MSTKMFSVIVENPNEHDVAVLYECICSYSGAELIVHDVKDPSTGKTPNHIDGLPPLSVIKAAVRTRSWARAHGDIFMEGKTDNVPNS